MTKSYAAHHDLDVLPESDYDLITDIDIDEPEDLSSLTEAMEFSRCHTGDRETKYFAKRINNSISQSGVRGINYVGDIYSSIVNDPKVPRNRIRFRHMTTRGLAFRGKRIQRTDGTYLLRLRRLPTTPPRLSDLSLPMNWKDFMVCPSLLRGGIILFISQTGQGKTTSMNAALVSRHLRFAGCSRSIEEPLEPFIDGYIGKGFCIQTEVDADSMEKRRHLFYTLTREALQDFPTMPGGGGMLAVSEISDPSTALSCVTAADAGVLVLATIHSTDLISGIRKFVNLTAQAEGMTAELAAEMISPHLRVAFHQTLVLAPKIAGWKRGKLDGQMCYSPNSSSKLANAIMNRHLGALKQECDAQFQSYKQIMSKGLSPKASFDQLFALYGGDPTELKDHDYDAL